MASNSPVRSAAQIASAMSAFSTICRSSRARSIGMVETAMAPVFITASHAANIKGELGATQQDAVAGYHAQFFHQHMAKPVGLGRQLGIAPDDVFMENRGFLRRDFAQRVVQQPLAAIERVGNLQLRQGKFENRPLVLGRQIVPGKFIAVQGGANCHGRGILCLK